jgi:hypothetical protein
MPLKILPSTRKKVAKQKTSKKKFQIWEKACVKCHFPDLITNLNFCPLYSFLKFVDTFKIFNFSKAKSLPV